MKKKKEVKIKRSGILGWILGILVIMTIVASVVAYTQINSEMGSMLKIFDKKEKQELYALEPFTLKLADGRNATISMTVGYTGKKTAEELKEKTPILRDKIIGESMKLESRHFQSASLERTKTKLAEKVSPLITEGTLQTIYFTDLIIL